MKSVIAVLVLVMGTTAFAGNTCTAQVANGATVELGKEDGLISVSHYGNSRNTHQALYAIDSCKWNRVGPKCKLKKVQDLSTWQDMPESLGLNGSFEQESFFLFGLYKEAVLFDSKPCLQVLEGI